MKLICKDLKVTLICLNPGLAFSFVRNHAKPHSFILTSGTLSPVESFESELMLDFPIKFENSHVINTRTQVLYIGIMYLILNSVKRL